LIILEKVGHHKGLSDKLGTSVTTGIIGDDKDLDRRKKFFGLNRKILPAIKPFKKIWLEEISDELMKILFAAGAFQIIVGLFNTEEPNAWLEGFSIMIACLVISLLMASCKLMQQKQENKIAEQVRNEKVQVIRGYNGTSKTCPVSEIVVGDLIVIEAGMRVPADSLLVEGMDIACDETMYEDCGNNVKKIQSFSVEKHVENPDPFLLARSFVRAGSGKALVLAVGN
jgi:magnesium-transporting ATPase (P-type)